MNFKGLLNKEWVRYVLALIVGITVGVVFYPSKRIEQQLSLKYDKIVSSLSESHRIESDRQYSEYKKLQSEFQSYKSQSENTISSLTTQVSQLKSKSKTRYSKIIHPDGTIEIVKDTENKTSNKTETVTQVEEKYKQKIESINKKWESTLEQKTSEIQRQFISIERSYEKAIEELRSSKTTTINEKRFGVGFGIMDDKTYYGNISADIWGPVYLGLQSNFDTKWSTSSFGAGIGIRF